MKANFPALALALMLSGCAAAPRPVPAPPPVIKQTPPPVVMLAPLPSALSDWRDAPRTLGDWRWSKVSGQSSATYGLSGTSPQFALTCDAQHHAIRLTLTSPLIRSLVTISTTGTTRTLDFLAPPGGRMEIATILDASDPIFDAMAFSRGRFMVSIPGAAPLYLPSWAEVSRVIEDCR